MGLAGTCCTAFADCLPKCQAADSRRNYKATGNREKNEHSSTIQLPFRIAVAVKGSLCYGRQVQGAIGALPISLFAMLAKQLGDWKK